MGDDALPRLGPRITVAIAAGTDRWESVALEAVASAPSRLTLVKRCLDLSDLLAVAATGTLRVVLLSATLDGLDTDSVERLRRAGVRSAVVVPTGSSDARAAAAPAPGRHPAGRRGRPARGLVALLEETASAELAPPGLADLLRPDPAAPPPGDGGSAEAVGPTGDGRRRQASRRPSAAGRVVAVWGPHGAPGRTTVAIGLAAEAAALGRARRRSSTRTRTAGRSVSTSPSWTRPRACWPRSGWPTPVSWTPAAWSRSRGSSTTGCGWSPVCPGPTGGPRCDPRP